MSELAAQPPEGIRVILNEEDVTDIQAIIEGPCKNYDHAINAFLELQTRCIVLLKESQNYRTITYSYVRFIRMHICINASYMYAYV